MPKDAPLAVEYLACSAAVLLVLVGFGAKLAMQLFCILLVGVATFLQVEFNRDGEASEGIRLFLGACAMSTLAVFTAEIFVRADTGQTSDTRVRIGGDPSSGTVHVAVTIGREWGNKQAKEVHGRVSGEHFQWQQKRARQRHNTINSPVR